MNPRTLLQLYCKNVVTSTSTLQFVLEKMTFAHFTAENTACSAKLFRNSSSFFSFAFLSPKCFTSETEMQRPEKSSRDSCSAVSLLNEKECIFLKKSPFILKTAKTAGMLKQGKD